MFFLGSGRGRSAGLWGATLLIALLPLGLSAQGPDVSFTGRIHAQTATSNVDGAKGIDFVLRRARVTAELEINDWITGKIQPEFAGGSATLRDAYVDLAFAPAFNVSVGQMKRAFDLFELESSTRNLVVERDGRIDGAGSCAGVGGICSYSRFTEKLKYSDRDIGLRVSGDLGGPVSYSFTVTNGEGQNQKESNSDKSFAGRLEFELADDFVVSPNVSVHDYLNETDPDRSHGTAWGVDVDWGAYAPGIRVQGAAVWGDNWKVLDADGVPETFVTAQGVVSYRVAVENNSRVSGVEPLVRVSWGDPDQSVDLDREMLYTAGMIAHLDGRNRIALNLDVWDGPDGESAWGLKLQTYLHF